MEPSSVEDGNTAAIACKVSERIASMEPSSVEDGNRPRRILNQNTMLRTGLRALVGETTRNFA
jgi:hypothetical protein